jgi:hypothetical protein
VRWRGRVQLPWLELTGYRPGDVLAGISTEDPQPPTNWQWYELQAIACAMGNDMLSAVIAAIEYVYHVEDPACYTALVIEDRGRLHSLGGQR